MLFVYGTLLPGESRWEFLQPYVTDHGVPAHTVGLLYDTGFGYPAAVFGDTGHRSPPPLVVGRVFSLDPARTEAALELLDEVEGAVTGGYQRIRISTTDGVDAWAYECTDEVSFTPITDGDWRAWVGSGIAQP